MSSLRRSTWTTVKDLSRKFWVSSEEGKCTEKLEEKEEESGEKRSCLPPSSTCLNEGEGLYLKEAIALVGNDSWRTIGKRLAFRDYHLSDIPTEHNTQSKKIMHIIEKW